MSSSLKGVYLSTHFLFSIGGNSLMGDEASLPPAIIIAHWERKVDKLCVCVREREVERDKEMGWAAGLSRVFARH